MSPRTDEERLAAVESMFRTRAVESPPDEHGTRTIWHRGPKGAELVTDIDESGRVTRQELALFDDVLVWSGGKLKTGQARERGERRPRPSDGLTWDDEPGAERLERIGRSLKKYRGVDRFVQHVRDVLGVSDDAAPPLDAPVTGSAEAAREALAHAEARRRERERQSARTKQLAIAAFAVGAALAIGGLVMLWLSTGS
ncbi:MAG: hypothetical protein JNJ54_26675 [Myxococcaceae bacterium]|nr:hypothetical protein [Myxococcaceae bacterium]